MKFSKNNYFNFFPSILGRAWLLSFALLMGFSVYCNAQLHISDNTVFTVVENTTVHVVGQVSGTVAVTIQKKVYTKSIAGNIKKSKKPSQPPMAKEDTEPENRTGVLSFTSKQKEPSALYYSGKATKAALVQNISSGTKSFPDGNVYNYTTPTLSLNDDEVQIKASNELLPSQQIYLDENTTRPPPFSDQCLI